MKRAPLAHLTWVREDTPESRHRKCDECPYEDGHRCSPRLTECGQ